MAPTADPTYQRINRIRSVTEMGLELKKLPRPLRREVILLALGRSMHQFTWSHFAKRFRVAEKHGPPEPKGLRAYWFGEKAETSRA